MLSYIVRRTLQTIPVIVAASVLVFLLIHFLPGDPAIAILGENATQEMVAAMREKLGLNEPLHVQYFLWAGRMLQGDMGTSIRGGHQVSALLKMKMVATGQLVGAAFLLSMIISFPVGITSALKQGSTFDHVATTIGSFFISVPNYFLGVLLVLIFALRLDWLPSSGYVPFGEEPKRFLQLLILPAFTMATGLAAVQSQFIRSAFLEVLSEDYIRTARAKGLAERLVVANHALKNALISVVTILGLQLSSLLTGSVLTETLFGWPGMGRVLVNAIMQRDYNMVQANILLLLIMFTGANLIVDVSYAWLDPRVTHQ